MADCQNGAEWDQLSIFYKVLKGSRRDLAEKGDSPIWGNYLDSIIKYHDKGRSRRTPEI